MTEQLHTAPIGTRSVPGRIVATEVPQELRPQFLPKRFGPAFLPRGEMLVYDWMRRLCDGYRGGFWRFVELSNGGFYMAPTLPGPLHIRVDGNGFSGELGADAAGVVASLFALCQLAHEGHGQFDDAYYLLLDFACQHEERTSILSAID
jgi:hypothetical protein